MTHRWKYHRGYSSPRANTPARCTREGCGLTYYMESRPPKVKTYYNSPVEYAVYVLPDGTKVEKLPTCGATAAIPCPTCKGKGTV